MQETCTAGFLNANYYNKTGNNYLKELVLKGAVRIEMPRR